jgi:uncharacterized protein YbbC (DUF1343 family)
MCRRDPIQSGRWAVFKSGSNWSLGIFVFFVLLGGAPWIVCGQWMSPQSQVGHPAVKLGVEVLFEKRLNLIRGRKIGLITNPTSLDHQLNSTIDLFSARRDLKLVALYGPEHGVRGNVQAGQSVAGYFDNHLELPVFSLYGPTRQPLPDMLTNLDHYLRSFAIPPAGSMAEAGRGPAVDVLVFDLQDVGARVYTYVATMAYAMQAAAAENIPFIVLDRPNPINGLAMEGPVLGLPTNGPFVGLLPIPLRHGMTAGELALLINDKFLLNKCQLTVVPMENWTRDEWFDQTSLPWTMPSPNMPTLATAMVYPGQALIEGTNLSEGRGTTRPFELFGAPWIDGFVLAQKLNRLNLPGVKFREAWFTPTFSKFSGTLCGGCQLYVTDRNLYQSVATTLNILSAIRSEYGDKLQLRADYFDKAMSLSGVRRALEQGEAVAKIVACFQPGLEEFARERAPYLLYR